MVRLHSPPSKCSEQIRICVPFGNHGRGCPSNLVLFTAVIHFALCSGSRVGNVKNLTPWHVVLALLFVQPTTQQELAMLSLSCQSSLRSLRFCTLLMTLCSLLADLSSIRPDFCILASWVGQMGRLKRAGRGRHRQNPVDLG